MTDRYCSALSGISRTTRRRGVLCALIVLTTVVVWVPALGQATDGRPASNAKAWRAPRTAGGQPELQGIWTNATLTPLERPRELANKAFFTEQEAASYQKRLLVEGDRDRR